ncbi:hypothetical protein UCDDA912_g06931 [Diaporthe ampelina]|uniref:Uncharacterized protein n=1 Tax=Diaporthe ampelina TaxID=1214573 RepID=A0A0G2FEX9_9PEZI|nr:hypothetical protein UCDDA912_g06931 [Diaporthe ampelina]
MLCGGPLFNLGGLGASREAQYLSREHGIPRSEYSANIHLIRSSEVDPFAPAPGSTRTAAARAAARAQAETHSQSCSQVASGPSPDARVAPDLAAHGGLAALAAQLQAVKDELAEAKRALRRVQAKGGKAETPMTSHLLSTAIVLTVIFFIGKDVTERVTAPPSPADGLVQAQTIAHEVDAAAAQRRSDAPAEEQALAESGLTSFEVQPSVPESHPRSSVLSGLFWART